MLNDVSPNGDITPIQESRLSNPSPIIALEGCSITNVHWDDAEQRVRGDINVAGSITSSVCDFTAGNDGTIDQVAVCVNSHNTPTAVLGTLVTKQTQPTGDLLRPYPFSATFSGTLPNVIVDLGYNLIRVFAFDKIFNSTGYSDAIVEVAGQPPENVTVDLEFDLSGMNVLGPLILPNSSIYASIKNINSNTWDSDTLENSLAHPFTFSNADNSFEVVFNAAPSFDPSVPDSISVVVTKQSHNVFGRSFYLYENATASKVFKNDNDAGDYHDWSFTSLSADFIGASDGGRFYPMVLEVVGPTNLLTQIDHLETADGSRKVTNVNGRFLMQTKDSMSNVNAPPAILLGAPKADSFEDLDLSNPISDFIDFHAGVVVGFANGGWSLLEGLFFLGKENFRLMNPMGIAIVMTFGDHYAQEKKFLLDTKEQLEPLARFIWSIRTQQINALLMAYEGDYEGAIKKFSEAELKLLEFYKEVFAYLFQEYVNATPYEKGKIQGRIAFEILLLLLPYIKAAQAGEVAQITKIEALTKLLQRPFVQATPPVRAAVEASINLVKTGPPDLIFELIGCARRAEKLKAGGAAKTVDALHRMEVVKLGRPDLYPEVGYKSGARVLSPYGKRIGGGVRIDVVHTTDPASLIFGPYEHTYSNPLTLDRVAKIRANLLQNFKTLDIYEYNASGYRIWVNGAASEPAWIPVP